MVASLKSLTAAQTIRILIQTHDLGDGRCNLNAGTNRKYSKYYFYMIAHHIVVQHMNGVYNLLWVQWNAVNATTVGP